MGRRRTRIGLAAVVTLATAAAGAPGPATSADAPIAIARDLGTGVGTSSSAVALAGHVVVGYTEGTGPGHKRLFQYDLDDPSATMRVLDDGGIYANLSTIVDADGPYVAGTQQVGTASTGAFVFDARSQAVVRVPRLGDLHASARAIDQGVVVGRSQVNNSGWHAFAYDVDGAREVLDLGTLGGPDSDALDVSGDAVVGQSDGADLAGHAFVVDLAVPGRPMVDLGTLGGAESAATAVSGDVVVGWAEAAGGARRAFAVRRSTPGRLASIGTLGGPTSEATDVAGEIVVGTSTRPDGSVGIWWTDLRTVPYVLRDLGTQAASAPGPRVVGGRVIGTRMTPAGDRGFVLDVETGSVWDLDPLPGHVRSAAADVAGVDVVGSSYAAGGETTVRATAWTLGTVPAPSFRLARKRTKVSEGTTTRIKVVRSGDVREAADVRYRVSGTRRGATAGKDFRKRRGVVHFEAGQVRAYVRVRIRDDRVRERREKARVRIRAVTPGTTVTTARRAWLIIRASDRR
jgi:probable HAF family extracellular repeat protein